MPKKMHKVMRKIMINYWIYSYSMGPVLKQADFKGIKFKKMSHAAGKHQWTIIEVSEI